MPSAASTPPQLKVVVVEDDPTLLHLLKHAVSQQLGHTLVGAAATGPDMVDTVLATRPDVVIFDIHLPGESGLDALRRIYDEHIVAAVAITADRDSELVSRALEEHVMAYLVKPFETSQLQASLHLAWVRFQHWQALLNENATLKQTLQKRKVIERAKGLLMQRYRWSEPEAFRRLQRTAMNRRLTMAELAQAILDDDGLELDKV